MAWTAPTAADLKARFPAFAAVGDVAIAAALAEAEGRVDGSWSDALRTAGALYYAAHVLTLDGLGTSTEAQLAGFRRLRIGSLELESAASSATSANAADLLRSTSYGRRFAAIAGQVSGPGILVV